MNSLTEKMQTLRKFEIDSKEEFVLQIKHKGILAAEVMINVQHLEWAFAKGEADVTLNVINPKPIQ